MNKRSKLTGILLTAVLLFTGIFCLNVAAADNTKQVDIMFVHDTHSHLNEFTTVENGQSQTMGGFAKIKTLINQHLSFNI